MGLLINLVLKKFFHHRLLNKIHFRSFSHEHFEKQIVWVSLV